MEVDDIKRGNAGVVCSVKECGNGKIRINLDDVLNPTGDDWKHEALVTWKDYDKTDFENLNFSESEFAAFGHYVMARLSAIKKKQTDSEVVG